MSEKKGSFGFFFKRPGSDDAKKRTETHAEEGISNVLDRAFVKEFTMEAMRSLASSLESDGTPSEIVEGALAMFLADVQLSRFSGNVGDRKPITAEELRAKEDYIAEYKALRDYLGPTHPWVQRKLVRCQAILHNHMTRGTPSRALEFKTLVPWDIMTKGPGGQNQIAKKDALEPD